MADNKSILHELYVFSEWKPEPEYLQKTDNILPENLSNLWRWLKFFGLKKSLIDSVSAHKEKQQKWHIALGDEGKVIAVLTDNILEIRTKRSEYATIAARTTVARDAYPQWRKLVWSPDCSFLVVAYGNGIVSFFDLTASNLFNIPVDCSRPGGMECTDNTHAVSDIIFMPHRVKDTKWNWEVLIVTYDGRLRGYLLSQTDGYKLHHRFQFPGGVAAASYCEPHATLYVSGIPKAPYKEPTSPVSAGITAWRVLNDEPFYKLSVVSDELEAQLANERFHLYIPLIFSKNMNFIIHMVASPDSSKLVCIHCNGDISIWRLPVLKIEYSFKLIEQPDHSLESPLTPHQGTKDQTLYYPADVNWWSNEEIIVSRFSGAVSICSVQDLVNILGKKPEFFQGTPQVTCAYDGAFMALECESNVMPAKKSTSDESMEVIKADEEVDRKQSTMLEISKELVKSILYAITDMETFQPKPKKITVVSRIYRLLGVKSTTPAELFSRKIESGSYTEALSLAENFGLDSDMVYQQQWRKNPVSSDAIQNYLSKVSKKIWAVHQCVDRLPESLTAAKELLSFGLQLTNQKILDEINGSLPEDEWKDPDSITLEDLNAYTSELLRCRHVMLFYKERLGLYEAILRCEKSNYVKDEYHRLRSSSIVHSAMEIAKEGRIEALTCLWPYIKSLSMQLAVLDKLPESIYPLHYQHLLPTKEPLSWFEKKSPIKIKPSEHENDWCRKEIFRSIWSSNWSEEITPEPEGMHFNELVNWYDKRAREIIERSGLVSHAVTLINIAKVGGAVEGLDKLLFHLTTLDTLIYDINIEGVTLDELEEMSNLDTCKLLVKMSTPATLISDIKNFVTPFLKRYENLTGHYMACHCGVIEFLVNISIEDLSHILLILQSPKEFPLDVETRLLLVERCLFAHTGTEQLDMACDILNTLLKDTDGTGSHSYLVRRCAELERLVSGCSRLAWRGVPVPPCELRNLNSDAEHARLLLTRVARSLATGDGKPSQQDWENLLKDILELRITLFDCITEEQCYEIYAFSLLTSGDASSIGLASDVLTVSDTQAPPAHCKIGHARSVELVSCAAKEYFNSSSSLKDPALELARCCLLLIEDGNKEIEQELDLICALPILRAFNVNILPIQVRLCEDKMELIEQCLNLDPNAYLASHKLLKLAKLLRIAGDDDQTREGMVLVKVGEHALAAGAAGGGAAGLAARRLAALRHAPAAQLLARIADNPHAHADTADRRQLLATAMTYAKGTELHDMLRSRLKLELESLQQMSASVRDTNRVVERWPSVEDEFADAITTPVIEKKDLVAPSQTERTVPLLNYLLDSFQNKFTLSNKSQSTDSIQRSVHCQEFYRSLYPEHNVSAQYYCYDRFSIPDDFEEAGVGQSVLKWFYIQSSLDNRDTAGMEIEVIQKCAEEILYKDTPLSVACLLRSVQEPSRARRMVEAQHTDVGVSAALYATLVKCNSPQLRDDVYLTEPRKMANMTLQNSNASEEQMAIVRQCIDKLSGMGEVDRIRRLGLSVNSLLFNADQDYRREVIYRLARSGGSEQVRLACSLAVKHELDAVDIWLQYAMDSLATIEVDTLPSTAYNVDNYNNLKDTLWPTIRGNNYAALINFFTILKKIDDKSQMYGLTATEHIKLLKKAKAASQELDYKLLLEQPPAADFISHVLSIIKPENVGLLTKFLRTLPSAFKLPVSVNSLYTMWLTKYFFSVGTTNTSKKWMQQWRQCASYFTKLPKEELLEFVAATCFTREALLRVPSGTRNIMILQAVDYCQQEQENDFKFNKNEQSWAQVGQELSRWARFLENYHSGSVQAIVDSDVPKELWPELEMSHGEVDKVTSALGKIVLVGGLKPSSLTSLLQCLHVAVETQQVFEYIFLHCVNDLEDMQTLVTRLTQYHKEGVKFSEEFLERVMDKAVEFGLPPHKQLGLLSLSQRTRVKDGDDLRKVAQSTVDLFRTEWPESKYAQELTDEQLLSMEGRRAAFSEFLQLCDSWQRKKALVDVLACWPPTHEEERSLHCDYLQGLLSENAEQKESLVLIKLLMRRPVLIEEEVKWLAKNGDNAIMNTIWVILLSRCECSVNLLRDLLLEHKELVQKEDIEEDLIKEILDQGIFIKLVSTPLYSSIVNYILSCETSGNEHSYTVRWATTELIKANYLAEAGHLQLLAIGVPLSLQGFSQSVLYCKNMFK